MDDRFNKRKLTRNNATISTYYEAMHGGVWLDSVSLIFHTIIAPL